jgi:hypothetical protein
MAHVVTDAIVLQLRLPRVVTNPQTRDARIGVRSVRARRSSIEAPLR